MPLMEGYYKCSSEGVVPVLLFGSECWSLRKEYVRRLLAHVRDELTEKNQRQNYVEEKKIINEQTKEELGAQETVVQEIKKRMLLYSGLYVERMEGERLPKCSSRPTWTCRGKEKQREAEEVLDGQCQ